MAEILADKSMSTGFLDGLRGLAALYVVIHHGIIWMHSGPRTAYVFGPNRLVLANTISGVLLGSFRFGHAAVIFFFVLSGFVIHLRYARKFVNGQALPPREWLSFMYRRARRLYPPLLLAIVITWGVDRIGMSRDYGIYFGRTPYTIVNHSVRSDHQYPTLLGNLLFLMGSRIEGLRLDIPVWGSNGPLWSLKFEWWFYAIYPAFWYALRRSWFLPTLAVAMLFAASIMPWAWPIPLLQSIFSKMLVWWLGVLLAELYCGRLAISWLLIAPFVLLIPAAALYTFLYPDTTDLLWGVGFAGLIASGFELQRRGFSLNPLTRLKFLGDCSYTLYVIHAPLVVFAGGWLMAHSPAGQLPGNFLVPFLTILIVPIAYILHFVVELPFIGHPSPVRTRKSTVLDAGRAQ